MNTTRTAIFLAVPALVLALTACKPDPAAAGADDHAAAAPEPPTNRVSIPAVVRGNLGITFVKVERREVANTVRVPGAFELRPRARHEHRMALPGHVDLLVDQYETVAPGDVLFRFRSPQWPELQHEIIAGEQAIDQTDAEIVVARAKLDEAAAQLALMRERLKALAAVDFKRADLEADASAAEASVPRLRAELQLAETKRVNAERTRDHAVHRAAAATGLDEAALSRGAYRDIEWIDVRATDAGIVEALAVTDGAYVESSKLVLSIVDPTDVRFRALGLQSDLPKFTNGATARIVPPRSPGLDLGSAIDATLTIGLEAHPEERTITLLATPAERLPWFRPGVSAFLEIVAESSDGFALAVPRSAVMKDGIEHVIFVRDRDDPDQAVRVEADLGVDDGRWIVLNSGVQLDDEVVVDGAYELKLAIAQRGGAPKAGHFHADGTFHGAD